MTTSCVIIIIVIIIFNLIYNHVVLIMVIVDKRLVPLIQIWLNDSNWTLVRRCVNHESHVLVLWIFFYTFDKKTLINHLLDINKHVMGSKIHVKVWIFQCEMKYKWLKKWKTWCLKINKSKFLVVGKFQHILFLRSSLDGGLYFNFLKHYHGIFFESTFFTIFNWHIL